MNATLTREAIDAAVNAAALGFNDAAAMPGIDVPNGATFSTDAAEAEQGVYVTAYQTIKELIADQKDWFNGVHQTANEQLYLILQRCYDLYKSMASDAEAALKIDRALDQHFMLRNIETKCDTKLSKIIYCVFGISDRRRVSSYALALRAADDDGITVEGLPAFLRDAGGVEEVRRSKSADKKTADDKASIASDKLTESLLVIDDRNLAALLKDKTKHGQKVVLVASQGANGALIINAVEDGDSVVKATLTALYQKNKKEWGAK